VTILLDEEANCPLGVQHQALSALLRAFAAAAAAPAGSRLRKSGASLFGSVGPAASGAVSRALGVKCTDADAAGVASEGIKAFAAALALADNDQAKAAILNVLLPLLIAAAAPGGHAGVRSTAVTLITRTASAAQAAFQTVVAGLPGDSKERLQAALRSASAGAPAAVPTTNGGAAPSVAGASGARAPLKPPTLDMGAFRKKATHNGGGGTGDDNAF
jgi:hypothetical protein